MIYTGTAIQLAWLDNHIVQFTFDRKDASVNKFDEVTLNELTEATELLYGLSDAKGLLMTSAKPQFVVGADITEFPAKFEQSEEELVEWPKMVNALFSRFEDLPLPTVCAVNGLALGGGCEIALCCDYRVISDAAMMGFPEVNLGLIPGFAGTVRAPRLMGVATAANWICSGKPAKAAQCLQDGIVDEIASAENLQDAALALLEQCIEGELNHLESRQVKLGAAPDSADAIAEILTAKRNELEKRPGRHYPAPFAGLDSLEQQAQLTRDEATDVEARVFTQLCKTDSAQALVGLFLNEQAVKKSAKTWAKAAAPVSNAAVLGAGIMGGGIAHQSASRGVPIVMKDIAQEALDLGISEAQKLVNKNLKRGKVSEDQASAIMAAITPTLNNNELGTPNIVVEAVVENPNVKIAILSELENLVADNTILASNTSTISIDKMAAALQRPANFIGMHFFNPVHAMPLVEVIRGEHTSDEAIATTVGYATQLGKNPIVVKDCPGFLVNRVLFPYLAAFSQLLQEGGDLTHIDNTMTHFGLPMGPGYLSDVVGLDTGAHCFEVMAEGFPDRMTSERTNTCTVLYNAGHHGQKNGTGYYSYSKNAEGKPTKAPNPELSAILADVVDAPKSMDEQTIIERLMLPLVTESIRCLEEGIADSAADIDMAMLYGINFPRFRGGPLRYADSIGAQALVALCDKYSASGAIYKAPELLKQMAAQGGKFYPA